MPQLPVGIAIPMVGGTLIGVLLDSILVWLSVVHCCTLQKQFTMLFTFP
jgi:hypothetical protein